MSRAELEATVIRALADAAPHIDATTVSTTADFHDDLELDSLDFLEFVAGLAELTGLEIPEADYGEISSIATTVDYLTATADHVARRGP